MEVVIGVIFVLFVVASAVFGKNGGQSARGGNKPHKTDGDDSDDTGYPPSYYH